MPSTSIMHELNAVQEASSARTSSNGAGGAVWAGIRAGQLTEELRDMHEVHVLRFEGLQPGNFGGWSTLDHAQQISLSDDGGGRGATSVPQKSSALSGAWYPGIVERFDHQFNEAIRGDSKWCCRCVVHVDVLKLECMSIPSSWNPGCPTRRPEEE